MKHSGSLIFGFVIFSALCLVRTAECCVYKGGVEPPCFAYWKADVVFAGIVSDMTRIPRDRSETFDKLLIHLIVLEPYRGVENAEVEVTTTTGTECDTKFEKGEKWLIYAQLNSATSMLQISARTNLYSRANEDLAYIRSLSESLPESSLMVRVFEMSDDAPLKGIRIEIEGNGMKHRNNTDSEGTLVVSNLKPGSYLIRAIFEAGTAITGFVGGRSPSKVDEGGPKFTLVEYPEEIKAGRCGYLEIFVYRPRSSKRP